MQQEFSLKVDRLNCASCVKKIEDHLASRRGILDSSVNFASGHATVSYDPALITEDQIIEEIGHLGYPAHRLLEHEDQGHKINWAAFQLLLCLICSLPLAFHMVGLPVPIWLQVTLATIVQCVGGYSFYLGTWYGLRSFSANMDTLVALGTSAAYGFSIGVLLTRSSSHLYFETSALLILFILFGRWLEKRAKQRANQGMSALLRLQPTMARVKIGQEYQEIPAEKVPLQAIFLIRPGERIPVDGVILSGESYVDEAMLTGESTPTLKREGNPIYAGTMNGAGLLEAKAIKVGPETALGHIIRLVEHAQSSKAPVQRVADQVTAIFVPCVLMISLLTFFIWWIASHDLLSGLMNAVAVLVIACPCALGLATPTVIMVACGRAAKEGILIKDASVLEIAQNIKIMLLDKTGTVTEGKLSVVESHLAIELRALAYALAQHSDHPASQAIADYFKEEKAIPVTEYTAHPGKGISARYQAQTYYLGSPAFLKSMKVSIEEFTTKWEKEPLTVVAIASQEHTLGYFLLADRLKEGAKEAIDALHQLDIATYLLTGDRFQIAARIAQELHVNGFEAEILPSGKAAIVESFKKKGQVVGMVGDGINDAPALATADVGFGIGSGTDVALESSSVILVHSTLDKVVATILLAKATFRKIRQNLFFAFGYNVVGIPLAAFGLLNPIIAGIAMALSSISVVTNALLLQRK
jgi:Cu+-exporting ATPase